MLQLLTGLLDQHGDTAQQAALLAYLRQGEEAQPYLEVNTELWLVKWPEYWSLIGPDWSRDLNTGLWLVVTNNNLQAVLTARLAHTAYKAVSKEDKYEAAR